MRRLELLAAGFLKADGEPYAEKIFSMALRKRVPDSDGALRRRGGRDQARPAIAWRCSGC